MKLVTLVLLLLSGSALALAQPSVKNVKTVYILRMSGGLDQYLASALNKGGFIAVTTDPAKADALVTDSIGEGFEKKYAELYLPPPPKPVDDKDKKDAGLKGDESKRGPSSWSRSRGSVFLVDRQSRAVLWSITRQPKDTQSRTMMDHAARVVKQLKIDLGLMPAKGNN